MALYRIADLTFQIQPQGPELKHMLASYGCTDGAGTITVPKSPPETEVIDTLRQISLTLLRREEGCFLHGAALEYGGKAYLFTAPSGTGKTTHIRLWLQRPELNARILNGDKPLLRFCAGVPMLYGTPWQGKERLGYPGSAPLAGIYMLRRGSENKVTVPEPEEALAGLLDATVYPRQAADMDRFLNLMDRLLQAVPVRVLHCTPDAAAVDAVLSDLNTRKKVNRE